MMNKTTYFSRQQNSLKEIENWTIDCCDFHFSIVHLGRNVLIFRVTEPCWQRTKGHLNKDTYIYTLFLYQCCSCDDNKKMRLNKPQNIK